MQVQYARSLLKSTPGYVCLSYRRQYARLWHRSYKRFQHTDNHSNRELQSATTLSSFSDRIRHFLSENHIIEEQDKASAVTKSNDRTVQITAVDRKVGKKATKNGHDEEIKNALIEEFFAREDDLQPTATALEENELLQKASKKVALKEAILERRKARRLRHLLARQSRSEKKSTAKTKAMTEMIPKRNRKASSNRHEGDKSESEVGVEAIPANTDLNTDILQVSASRTGSKNLEDDSSKGSKANRKTPKGRTKKTKADGGQPAKTESEGSENLSKKAVEPYISKDAAKASKTKPRVSKQKAEDPIREQPKQVLGKQRLIDRLTSRIAAIQIDLKKKASKDQIRRLSKDHADLLRRKKALVRGDSDSILTRDKKIKIAKDVKEEALVSVDSMKDEVDKEEPVVKAVKKTAGKRSSKSQPSKSTGTQVKQKKIKSEIYKADASKLKIQPVSVNQPPVPSLAYGLERVLFNPGIYQLQDPRSRVYNFDPYLQNVMPVAEFDFNALKEYITSSRDDALKRIAQEQKKRYIGSTSSMTSMLAHFHFLLSQWRPINTKMLSKDFPDESKTFTELQRCPSAIFLRWKDGTYAIDADKQFDNANILSMLGKSMEKLLTLPTNDFERYRKSSESQVSEEEQLAPESYHYSTMGDFLMRSQLDAHDSRLPGTGMFDLKTRAVVSIRMDVENYQQGIGYQIKDRQGAYESYEREYYDMIRAAFLKYSMQVRMGRMDGIFVAFHNIERVFGFQYISLNEMDSTIHGQWDTSIGDQEFTLSLDLLNKILDRATQKFPETSLRLHFETRDAATPFMYIFAEPVTEKQVNDIQSQNATKIQDFERDVLGRNQTKAEDERDGQDDSEWDDIQANVQSAMDEDEFGPSKARDEQDEGQYCVGENSDRRIEDIENQVRDSSEHEYGEKYPLYTKRRGDEVEDEEPADAEEDEEVGQDNIEDRKGIQDDATNPDDELLESEDNLANDERGSDESGIAQDDSPTTDAEKSMGQPPKQVANMRRKRLRIRRFSSESKVVRYLPPGEAQNTNLPPEGEKNVETQADTPFLEEIGQEARPNRDVLAMTLTLRNKINELFVLRPEKLTASDKWSIEYSLVEVPDQSRAWALYEACQARRRKKLDAPVPAEEEARVNYYVQNLRKLSEQGRKWKDEMDEKDKVKPVRILGVEDEKAC